MLFRNITSYVAFILVSGCGFTPLYMPKTDVLLEKQIQGIKISPIQGRSGQLLLIKLEQALTPHGQLGVVKYVLNVNLSIHRQSLALKKSAFATRANITYIAGYNLIEKATGKRLTNGKSRVVASYNILTEAYATLVAEKDTQKRLTREMGLDISNKVRVYFKTRGRKRRAID